MFYKLDENNNVVPVAPEYMADFYENLGKYPTTVAKDEINGIFISTVFLGMDTRHSDHEKPIVFETMLFGSDSEYNNYQERYATWDEALARHKELCEIVRKGKALNRKPLTIKLNI